jgi:succinoglycan biosynthesis transport protein ExoP
MLQANNLARLRQHTVDTVGTLSASEFYSACLGFLRRQRVTIATVLCLSLAVGFGYFFLSPSLYTARAILIVDAPKSQVFQSSSSINTSPLESSIVDTQLQILTSDDLALSVIKSLHLEEEPEFYSPQANPFEGMAAAGAEIFNRTLQSLSQRFLNDKNEIPTNERALRIFQRRLNVKRVALTYAIQIEFTSHSPSRAAQIANMIADAYAVEAFEAKYQITGRAAQWLQERLKELREQTAGAEHAVLDYKERTNLVDSGGRPMNDQQLVELNSQLVQARASTAEAEARLKRVEQIVASSTSDPEVMTTATVSDALHNDVISRMRARYLDDERRASEWRRKYGSQHLAVVNLVNEMHDLQWSIFEELKRTAESYKSDYAIAKAREESIRKSLDQAVSQSRVSDKAQITLHQLESSAQSYRELYDNFLHRHMESVQQQSSPVTESRLITHARAPVTRTSPTFLLVTALSGLGGIIFGAALGMLRDISDRAFRTTAQVCEHLHADCLAVVPLIKLPRASSPALEFRAKALDGRMLLPPRRRRRRKQRRTLVRDNQFCWTVANSPSSRFSESIRAIKVAADSGQFPRTGRIIGVTSSLPNEGKSTIAISLAALISQGGHRAALIDCDLRNPALSALLAPDAKGGVYDLASGSAVLDDILWHEPVTGLAFLPAGASSEIAHSCDILASQQTRTLFSILRASYDYVIVDLPPLAPVVDVRVMSPLVDSFLFVVEWGRTSIDVVQLALDGANSVCDNLLGVVLNKVDINLFSRYANHHYAYYKNEQYTRYGYTD